jgi:hypothetical protein
MAESLLIAFHVIFAVHVVTSQALLEGKTDEFKLIN